MHLTLFWHSCGNNQNEIVSPSVKHNDLSRTSFAAQHRLKESPSYLLIAKLVRDPENNWASCISSARSSRSEALHDAANFPV